VVTAKLFILQLLIFTAFAVATPPEKRATQVSLTSWTFTNNVLSGSIEVWVLVYFVSIEGMDAHDFLQVQDLAYQKVVTVFYAVESTWSDGQRISAVWSAQSTGGYETWAFSGRATGATQFYIEYGVNGKS